MENVRVIMPPRCWTGNHHHDHHRHYQRYYSVYHRFFLVNLAIPRVRREERIPGTKTSRPQETIISPWRRNYNALREELGQNWTRRGYSFNGVVKMATIRATPVGTCVERTRAFSVSPQFSFLFPVRKITGSRAPLAR